MFPFPEPGKVLTKICGITSAADATMCAAAGADAIGVNFYPKSKRYHALEDAVVWLAGVPPHVARVAVFVNADAAAVRAAAATGLIDVLQFHGAETPEYCAELRAATGLPVIRALPVRGAEDLADFARWPVDALLLDAHAPGVYGGTGRTIDWTLAVEAVRRMSPLPVILSGGLTALNTEEAARAVRPAGVDTASGVEISPGVKDPEKTRALILAARAVF